jgi:hypothetical protein
MMAKQTGARGIAAMPDSGCGGAGAGLVPRAPWRRLARTLARWRARMAATPPARAYHDNWVAAAQEREFRAAVDIPDLERRQRRWDRDFADRWSIVD